MITLRGITWDHPRGYQPLLASIAPYAQEFGVTIEWDKRSLKDFGDAPIDALAEKYDLLILDHPHMGLAFATGCLLPLDEYIDADTLASLAEQSAGASHASYNYKGHQWALANDAAVQCSAYRPDLLESPMPDIWQQVLELGENARAEGRWIGIPLVPTDSISSFLSLCAGMGDPVGKKIEGQLLHDDQIGLQALEMLAALRDVCHPASLSWNPITMLDHMSSHDDLLYCPLTFTYSNYSRDGYADHLVQFTNAPEVTGALLGGAGYAVSARCTEVQAAVDYGVWLCSADVQRTVYVDNGGQPGNGLVWRDDHANSITANFFRQTIDTLEAAYVRPRHYGYREFQEDAGDIIHAMLKEGTSFQACLENLKTLYDVKFSSI